MRRPRLTPSPLAGPRLVHDSGDMTASLVLPLAVHLAVGSLIEVSAQTPSGSTAERLLILDAATGIRYDVPVEAIPAPESGRTYRARVEECTITGDSAGAVRTALVLAPLTDLPEDAADAIEGAAGALSGAERAAADAGAEAAWWGGVDRTPKPETPRFW